MVVVKNLNKGPLTTITGGTIAPGEKKKIADWEVAIIKDCLCKNIEVCKQVVEQKKKGKK